MNYTNTVELLTTIGQICKEQYKNNIKSGAYATGKLYNSVKYRIDVTERGVKLSFTELPEYYIYVEEGRVAGGKMPPVSTIQKWMISRNMPVNNGMAYAIARSIADNGIKPRPYIKRIKLQLRDYKDDITQAIQKDIEIMKSEKINDINKLNTK